LIAQLPYLQTKLKETPPQHLNINDGYLADSTKKKTNKKKKNKKLMQHDKTVWRRQNMCFIIPPHWLAQGECILGIKSKSSTLTKTLHEIVLFVQKC